jgi:hypothetical protein
LKNLEKEKRDTDHDFVKKIEALEHRNKHLIESHAAEVQKEKDEIKAVNKKLNTIEEKEPREIEKSKFEKAKKFQIQKETKVCQTDENPDVPYNITSPLSMPCHASNKVSL